MTGDSVAYRVSVTGPATIEFDAESGTTTRELLRGESVVVPSLPDITTGGSVTVTIDVVEPYECPECNVTHTDYNDKGTSVPAGDARGHIELVECGECGETIEFGVL